MTRLLLIVTSRATRCPRRAPTRVSENQTRTFNPASCSAGEPDLAVRRRDHDDAQASVVAHCVHREVIRDPPAQLVRGAADLDAAEAQYLDCVRRAQQARPHAGLVPRDVERPGAKALLASGDDP